MTQWIISSSVLIAVTVILRAVLRGKISRRLQYALWALVLVRLLVPVSFGGTALSVMNAAARAPAVRDAQALRGVDRIELCDGGTVEGYYSGDYMADFPTTVAESASEADFARMSAVLGAREIFSAIWIAGAGAMLLAFGLSDLAFRRRLRGRARLDAPGSFLPVYVTGAVDTPCLFGLFRPAIYVTPEAAENGTVLRHALEHETTHFYHLDHVWSALRCAALALHWYNPLAWLALVLSRRDAELACDEGTIARLGEGERAAYGNTLLDLTCEKRAARAIFCTATTMTGSRRGIRERITLIARRPRTRFIAAVAVVLAAAVAAGCTFTGAKREQSGFTPDTVAMAQMLSSAFPPAPVTDEKTVARLWSLYQGFEFDGERETIGQVWSISVTFSDSASGHSERFTIFQDGLCLLGDDYETYHVLRGGAEIYDEFYACFEAAKRAEPAAGAAMDIPISADGDIPGAVADFARDYVSGVVETWNSGTFSNGVAVERVSKVAEARITALTQMCEGSFGEQLWRLEYRLRFDGDITESISGGMQMDILEGRLWLTEWDASGQPYLLLRRDGDDWQRVCTTDTGEIGMYSSPEMLERYGSADAAAAHELYAAWAAQNLSLDVVGEMRAVSASDFTNRDSFGNVTPQQLASALNAAAEHSIDAEAAERAGYASGYYPFWWIENAFLEGGPDSWSSRDRHFGVRCGLTENIVEVYLTEDNVRDTAFFEDKALYDLVRHSLDYEAAVDGAAFEKFRNILVPQMESNLAMMARDAGDFTGYELTLFRLALSYEDPADGCAVELYDFDYALLTDDLSSVVWAGGMRLDGELRVYGFNGGGQLAVRYRNGERVCTAFMGNDFYYSPGGDTGEMQRAAERLREALDAAEAAGGAR